MRPSARLLAAVASAAMVVTTAVACSSDDGPESVVQDFVDNWHTGDLDSVGFVTPAGATVSSTEVAEAIAGLSGQLRDLRPSFTVGEADVTGDVARVPVDVQWPLSEGEEAAIWQYDTAVRLTEHDEGWRVIWEPAVMHPELQDGDELVVQRTIADRGDILDQAGRPLVSAHDVVDIGIWEARASDLESDLVELDAALRSIDVEIDLDGLRDRVDAADSDQFVPVITLRRDTYDRIRDRIRDLEATAFGERERHLAPTATFGRAVLGVVDDATAEIIENNPGVYESGDQVGQGGLSGAYDGQLRGTPGQTVLVARTAPDGDTNHLEVFSIEAQAGTDLETTLDRDVQEAAEEALHSDDRGAALVAMRVSDGAVLAVANTRGEAAEPVNLAFTASVPPGSTFKMVSGYGLLASDEITLDATVACPEELTIDGFTIGNAFSGDRGDVTFREATAISCNTAFSNLADRLGDDGLASAASALGIGGEWDLGLETFTGSVSSGGSTLERAVAAFGQGDTQVSPAAMAAATAAVARGEWLAPTLVVDPEAAAPEPVGLDADAVADLQEALREVVTSGTASALAGMPGEAVYGKTGSAEAGDVTHGWFVGWQGDLVVAVFVEEGESGSGSAVPLVDKFLRAVN